MQPMQVNVDSTVSSGRLGPLSRPVRNPPQKDQPLNVPKINIRVFSLQNASVRLTLLCVQKRLAATRDRVQPSFR